MHRPNDRARNERIAGYLTSPDALVPGCRHFCFLLESALALKALAPKLACPSASANQPSKFYWPAAFAFSP